MKEGVVKDFLTFRRMVSPIVIQVLFWGGVLLILAVGAGLIAEGATNPKDRTNLWLGIGVCVVGPLAWRIYCELTILFFRMNETLTAIRVRVDQWARDTGSQNESPVSLPSRDDERRWMPPGMR